jgi:hypothetical protein
MSDRTTRSNEATVEATLARGEFAELFPIDALDFRFERVATASPARADAELLLRCVHRHLARGREIVALHEARVVLVPPERAGDRVPHFVAGLRRRIRRWAQDGLEFDVPRCVDDWIAACRHDDPATSIEEVADAARALPAPLAASAVALMLRLESSEANDDEVEPSLARLHSLATDAWPLLALGQRAEDAATLLALHGPASARLLLRSAWSRPSGAPHPSRLSIVRADLAFGAIASSAFEELRAELERPRESRVWSTIQDVLASAPALQ